MVNQNEHETTILRNYLQSKNETFADLLRSFAEKLGRSEVRGVGKTLEIEVSY